VRVAEDCQDLLMSRLEVQAKVHINAGPPGPKTSNRGAPTPRASETVLVVKSALGLMAGEIASDICSPDHGLIATHVGSWREETCGSS